MKTFNKIIAILLILVLCLPFLTGCYDAVSIETLAYVIAVGIDKGENNNLKLSFQIAALSNASSNDGGSSSQYKSASVISVDCSTIDHGINLINSYISKKINLSHCKAIIISEDLAYDGLSEYIFTFVNNIEVRPNCNVLISKCTANDFLNMFQPSLESVSARYYELILNSSSYSGYIDNIYLADFYEKILDTTSQASTLLVNINDKSLHTQDINSENKLNGNYLAGETPINSTSKTEIMGLTAFKEDKLVGELNNLETLCHLIVTNKLEKGIIVIPNPFNTQSNISLSIGLYRDTSISAELVNNFPYISCNISIKANVTSMDYTIDLSDSENLKFLEECLNEYLEENISSYLYKTSKEFKSDIVGFGRCFLPKYLTWLDWCDTDWLNNYENSTFKINVSSNVESGYLYTKI